MKHRSFLHFALIASLVFGQIAASVHVVGHLEHEFVADTARYGHHPHPHQQHHTAFALQAFSSRATHEHPRYHAAKQSPQTLHTPHQSTGSVESPDLRADLLTSPHKNDSHNGDCAIYHAYIGASACLPRLETEAIVFERQLPRLQRVTQPVVQLTALTISIRGPPAAV